MASITSDAELYAAIFGAAKDVSGAQAFSDGRVLFNRSVRDVDEDKRRTYQYSTMFNRDTHEWAPLAVHELPPKVPFLSSSFLFFILFVWWVKVSAILHSPSGKRTVKIFSAGEKDDVCAEVCEGLDVVSRIKLSDVHGKCVTSSAGTHLKSIAMFCKINGIPTIIGRV